MQEKLDKHGFEEERESTMWKQWWWTKAGSRGGELQRDTAVMSSSGEMAGYDSTAHGLALALLIVNQLAK